MTEKVILDVCFDVESAARMQYLIEDEETAKSLVSQIKNGVEKGLTVEFEDNGLPAFIRCKRVMTVRLKRMTPHTPPLG